MIIPIKCEGAEQNKWEIIELQGTIATTDGSGLDGKTLGNIKVQANGKSCELTLGKRCMDGEVVKLPKPLTVFRKRKLQEIEEHGEAEIDQQAGVEYVAVGVITRKYLFKQRPKLVVAKAPKGSSPGKIV
eukprot:TRINITY_DN30565_c0_g1_i1.p1 TRINITY_DN30565_c0_g1~~TRINITY_DN30565_c0_g1_i1.p1  ORF type:complete len:130 (-),score=9.01 TRINITY_DN30565_c0_g1_i1:166-555(-)